MNNELLIYGFIDTFVQSTKTPRYSSLSVNEAILWKSLCRQILLKRVELSANIKGRLLTARGGHEQFPDLPNHM